ncbi:iron chaperone [Liberiplasma polymorphum]|uniref:iron chaperone n=1 Tax=Liberiplasma polymorphum TaxID=3374570 RepID=UPI003773A545
METLNDYLETVENPKIRETLSNIFNWIGLHYPQLEPAIKWNQPMYMHHGTFIIGFSKAKKHLNMAPEEPAITKFEVQLKKLEYHRTKMLIQVKDHQEFSFDLLKSIIDFVIEDKKDITSFWR